MKDISRNENRRESRDRVRRTLLRDIEKVAVRAGSQHRHRTYRVTKITSSQRRALRMKSCNQEKIPAELIHYVGARVWGDVTRLAITCRSTKLMMIMKNCLGITRKMQEFEEHCFGEKTFQIMRKLWEREKTS